MKIENLGGYPSISAFVEAKLQRLEAMEPTFASLFELMFSERENIMYERSMGYRIRSTIPIQVMMTFQGKRIHDFGFFDMSQYGPIQILPAHLDDFDIHKYGFIF